MICLDEERLKKIAAAVAGSLGSDAAAHVVFSQPDPFIDHLKSLAPPAPSKPQPPETRSGYTVKRSVSKLSREEQKEREEAATRTMLEVMRADS